MGAEAEGRLNDARALYAEAWDAAADDYEACVAAHFVARYQADASDGLRWNEIALARAEAAEVAGDARSAGFHASLHLNLGASYESLGRTVEARAAFARAVARLGEVPEGPYRDVVARGVEGGMRRMAAAERERELLG